MENSITKEGTPHSRISPIPRSEGRTRERYSAPLRPRKWGRRMSTLKIGPRAVAKAAPRMPQFRGYMNR